MSDVMLTPDDPIEPFRKWLAKSGGKLDADQTLELMKKLSDGKLSALQLNTLLQIAPTLVGPSLEFLKSVPQLSKDINDAQKAALESAEAVYRSHLAALERAMSAMTSDKGRRHVATLMSDAAKMAHDSIMKIKKSSAKERKGLGQTVWKVVGGGLAIAALVARASR